MKKKAGFTLIELMVTIAVLAILTGIAGYQFLSGLPERRVLSASRDLYAGLQEARSKAVTRGEKITISFNTGDGSYTISDSDGDQIAEHTFPDFIDLYEITPGGGDDSYTFDTRGMKTGDSGRVRIEYYKSGPVKRGVRVTQAGGISLIEESDENWN